MFNAIEQPLSEFFDGVNISQTVGNTDVVIMEYGLTHAVLKLCSGV